MSLTPHVPKPVAPPPVPTIDEAVTQRNDSDRRLMQRRGAGTTLLTSSNGLPDLGNTSAASAMGA